MWVCEDVSARERKRRCEYVKMSRCEDEQMWRWEDVKMRRCEDKKMWRGAGVKMSRCEDEQMWRWANVKMRRCEDEKVWRWEDVKMRRCEDEKVWRWADVKMRRCERRCEDEKVWRWEDEIQTPTIRRTLRSDALGKKISILILLKNKNKYQYKTILPDNVRMRFWWHVKNKMINLVRFFWTPELECVHQSWTYIKDPLNYIRSRVPNPPGLRGPGSRVLPRTL